MPFAPVSENDRRGPRLADPNGGSKHNANDTWDHSTRVRGFSSSRQQRPIKVQRTPSRRSALPRRASQRNGLEDGKVNVSSRLTR